MCAERPAGHGRVPRFPVTSLIWHLHHRIVVPVRGPLEIDIAWPDLRVAFELEGADHRDRSLVHDDDTERQNWLTIAGWHVVRTTYRRWVRKTSAVLAELDGALAHASSRIPCT